VNKFSNALREIRERYPQLFDERALHSPPVEDLVVTVSPIDIPAAAEFRYDETRRVSWAFIEDENLVQRATNYPPALFDEPWSVEPDEEDFDTSDHASAERRDFASGHTRAGTESLSIYLPFHFYPDGVWGVRFFERPVLQFAKMFWQETKRRGLPFSLNYSVKIVVYAVARHEFTHYLIELFALQLELVSGRQCYRPYYDQVYKKTYPTIDCIEETVANYWSLDNSVIRSPARLAQLFLDFVRRSPGAYAQAAVCDDSSIRDVEDKVAAQMNQMVVSPLSVPRLWGQLPRPYVQPWTRYENIDWTMNRSAGAILGPILNARPLRRTMKIYHR
jgi:hypothetical protein